MFRQHLSVLRQLRPKEAESVIKRLFSSDNKTSLQLLNRQPLPARNSNINNVVCCTKTPYYFQTKRFESGVAPSNMQKKILVWTKYYKSIEEVPNEISRNKMDNAMDWFRIRACTYMIIATALACIVYAISGKRARNRGESLVQERIDANRKLREEGLKEKESATTS
ncbi:hypothetical protein SNE40_019469 [Patella caerulea]|uniref:Uncharacterized protein n=1 Tax=Patella caerulea TaxID=87958 RepID=A0AAN8P5Y6_PATCE